MNSNVWRPLLIVATIVFCLAFTNVQAAQQTNPDPTGYTWKDNKSPEPKETATFIDISTTGTDLISAPGFTDFDNGSIGITTPFLVTLFGNLYGMGGAPLYVSINGVVSFGTPITGIVSSVNTNLPNASDPDNIIAVFWDDLDASNGGHIYYDVVGTEPNRMIIVQWSNLSFRDQTANLNFQIQIPETVTANPYYLVYGNMTSPDAARATGSSATIGLENSDGSLGTEYSYNIPNIIISGQTAIGFYPPLSLIALPRLVKGAGFADNMRVLWGSLTPSIVAVHFLLFSPVEEGVELTGVELSAMLPDDPNALDFDESKYISGINLYEDVDRNASISSSERNNNLIVAWQPSQQQPFSNNGTLVLTFGGQTVIATASRAYIGEVIFNTNVTPLPSEGEGFKMALHRVYYRGLASNASRIETLDYMTGSVYVEDGFNPYGSVSIMPYNYDSDSVLVTSGSSVVAMAFKLTIGTVEDVRIQTLTCRALSTGVISTDIISVTFYIDQNVNGRHDTGEPTAGTAFSFPTGDITVINAPLGQDFARSTIRYFLAEIRLRAATDLSMMNMQYQLAFQMDTAYLNMNYFNTPSLLGGSIVGATFVPRVQEFPKPAILGDDIVGRVVRVGSQSAVNQDPTGLTSGGGGCFISTAAFGSYAAETVVEFCAVRDMIVYGSQSGNCAVSLYYAVSPSVAGAIKNGALRGLVGHLLSGLAN